MDNKEYLNQIFIEEKQPRVDRHGVPDYEELFNENKGNNKPAIGILKALGKQNAFKIFISGLLFLLKDVTLYIPIFTANIINAVTMDGSDKYSVMWINFILMSLVVASNIPSHIWYSRFSDKMLRTVSAGMRNTLVKKLQHLSLTYHKEIESGRIQSKFLRDMEAIEFLNNQIVKGIVPAIFGVIVSIAIAASKSGTVTVFYLLVIPVNVILVNMFSKRMKKNNSELRHASEDVSANVSNMIEMIPVTKAHGLENEEISRLEQNIKNLKEKGLLVDGTNAYFGSIAWVVGQILSGVCLIFTAWLAIKEEISVGDIVLYQSYFSSISGKVTGIVNVFPELAKGVESIHSVSEIVFSDNIENNQGKIRLRYVHGSINFDNVCYRYPDSKTDFIKNFNLQVKKGECIALVGSSGSGKSTIVNMVIGFMMPTDGSLTIDGKPVDLLNLSSYRHFISVVPQNSILFTGTIRENILYGLEGVSEERLSEVVRLANVNEFTDKMPDGLDTYVGEHGGKLSGGQKQRISIARALIRDPKILILDEATSALDNVSEYHVQQAMNELIKDRTTFIVAHRLSTIRDADRIVVMENGKIEEIGTYDELIVKKGKFYELKNLNG